MNETRLIDIETRIAHQEDTLRTLDEALRRQHLDMVRLERRIDSLNARLTTLLETAPRELPSEETPPHY